MLAVQALTSMSPGSCIDFCVTLCRTVLYKLLCHQTELFCLQLRWKASFYRLLFCLTVRTVLLWFWSSSPAPRGRMVLPRTYSFCCLFQCFAFHTFAVCDWFTIDPTLCTRSWLLPLPQLWSRRSTALLSAEIDGPFWTSNNITIKNFQFSTTFSLS